MKSLFAILTAMILSLVLVACGAQETESTTPIEEAATIEEPAVEEPMDEPMDDMGDEDMGGEDMDDMGDE